VKNLTPELRKEIYRDDLVLLGYRGSIAHGMYVPNSDPNSIDDIDLMGIFLFPPKNYIGLPQGKETVERFIGKYDMVFYEFRKFIRLLLKSNPNVLGMLWLQDNHYLLGTNTGQLLRDNREIFSSKLAYKSFTGYAYSQLKRMTHNSTQGYMGEKRKTLVEKYGYDCYDDETTEFLTNSGWKSFDDIKFTDKLGTVSPLTGEFEFQNYLSTTDKLYTGKMYILEPYLSKCIITKNHNVLVSSAHRGPKNNYSNEYVEERSNWELMSLDDVLNNSRSHYHIRRLVTNNSVDYKDVDDSYLQLAGLFLSDGTVTFRNNKSGKKIKEIRVTQSKTDNGFYGVIRYLMSIYPIREYNYEKETIWILRGEAARRIYSDFGHSKRKHLPTWSLLLSSRQVKILWENMLLGDGTRKDKYDVYYTSVKQLASDTQAMLVVAGMPCTVNGPYSFETTFGNSTLYHVNSSNIAKNVHTLNFGKLLKCNKIPISKRDGYPVKELDVVDKRVVCFEVPNNTLITRNGGKISIQGNCKNASHCIRLLKMGVEFLSSGELNVSRHDAPLLLEIKRGEWSLDKVKKEAERLFNLADEAYIRSKLPEKPNYEKANEIVMEVLMDHTCPTSLGL
jgi:hypothetical protein